ncbi:sulfite exporter TauE/SafE family protein [Spongiibacter sp. KMU-158]|uniref:Probable membrane transporter protein n=1 Tax=Spongiibacter pelagi TaxID=2760804 RepID=A0A927BYK5_9GAMM|nr:sulfite exporter TauE/SafE family protein [Spongiibacter pelagi]MBD2857940.1 sulfite exporter TauE/SafE family protein [Spongiibacter pelagi]
MNISELGLFSLAFLLFSTVGASFITSITGMAGGALMLAAMNVYIPMAAVIPIHGNVQLINNAVRSLSLRAHLNWKIIFPFAVGTIIGAAIATFYAEKYYNEFLPLVVLLALIAYTLFRPKHLPQIKIKDHNFFWVGLATGAIGIIAGAIDPILAVFFMRNDLSKEEIVANKSIMQMIAHATKIPAFLYLGFSYFEHLGIIILLTVFALIGTYFGMHALRKVNQQVFFKIMEIALYVTGARLLYQLISLV